MYFNPVNQSIAARISKYKIELLDFKPFFGTAANLKTL
jgi:hypothetical protein